MLNKEDFLPPCNSTFLDLQGNECAKIVHDLVFERYGDQRKLYRSKRLKTLRKLFHPDRVDESDYKVDKSRTSVMDSRDRMENYENDHQNDKNVMMKADDGNKEYNGSHTFCIDGNEEFLEEYKNEKETDFLNDSIDISRQRMNLTYSKSVGSEDISDLLSDGATTFSNHSKSKNDNNNNTVMEESIEIDENEKKILHDCIDAQENAIQEFTKVLKFGRRKRGFAGSVPHIQAEKGLLVANLRKQALTASLNGKLCYFPKPRSSLKAKITISNIRCDTNVIGKGYGISPCYYLCIVQYKTVVLGTDIIAPDMHGIVEFSSKFVLENITNIFTINLLLFKLQLRPNLESVGWRMSLCKRQIELPKLVLVGNKEISISNINKTAFAFENEIFYANFSACVHMPTRKEGNLTIQRFVRKTKKDTKLVSQKRWCVIEGTDLKVYRCCRDVDYSEPIEVISLVYCKSCKPHHLTSTTLVLDFVHVYFSRTLYLPFNDKNLFREWLNHINMAIATTKTFGL